MLSAHLIPWTMFNTKEHNGSCEDKDKLLKWQHFYVHDSLLKWVFTLLPSSLYGLTMRLINLLSKTSSSNTLTSNVSTLQVLHNLVLWVRVNPVDRATKVKAFVETKAQKMVFLSPLRLFFTLNPEMDYGATILLSDHTVR